MSTITATTAPRTASSVVPDELVYFIAQARALQMAANAATDQSHAYQMVGRLYGDMDAVLLNLLTAAYGDDAAAVQDGMIECGEDATYVAAQVADANAYALAEQIAYLASDAAYAAGEDPDAAYLASMARSYPCRACGGTGAVPAAGWEAPEDVDNGMVACVCDAARITPPLATTDALIAAFSV